MKGVAVHQVEKGARTVLNKERRTPSGLSSRSNGGTRRRRPPSPGLKRKPTTKNAGNYAYSEISVALLPKEDRVRRCKDQGPLQFVNAIVRNSGYAPAFEGRVWRRLWYCQLFSILLDLFETKTCW